MKALVIGGAGFIGSHLVNYLSKKYEVYVLDNLSVGKINSLNEKAKFIIGDVRDRDSFVGLPPFEYIFFAPGIVNSADLVRYPYDSFDVTVRGLDNVLKYTIGKIVYFSTSEIYSNGDTAESALISHKLNKRSGYDYGKFSGEVMLYTNFLQNYREYMTIRPFNVYGDYEYREGVIIKFLKNVLNQKPITIYGDGSQNRTFTFIDDFILGVDVLLNNFQAGETYNICGDENITINDLYQKVIKFGYVPCEYVEDPEEGIMNRKGNNSKLKSLGWKPKISIDEGLDIIYEWMKKENFEVLRYGKVF